MSTVVTCPAGPTSWASRAALQPPDPDLQDPHTGPEVGLLGHDGLHLRRGHRADRRSTRVAFGHDRGERPIRLVRGGVGQVQVPGHRTQRIRDRLGDDRAVLLKRRHHPVAQLGGLVGVADRRPADRGRPADLH
jgi:hypothetical protein